ncbi:uncharacterized protein LOC111270651 [Varroa jacobsoni]|uniref:uncharacterized protein LOC111270651 n=1 Tax=Varroa jacobsoni TaxID=62625 RepID=UPI000BFA1478|nr:uncharacterized protein LOC111270651 [Varroa jacobsoni]
MPLCRQIPIHVVVSTDTLLSLMENSRAIISTYMFYARCELKFRIGPYDNTTGRADRNRTRRRNQETGCKRTDGAIPNDRTNNKVRVWSKTDLAICTECAAARVDKQS